MSKELAKTYDPKGIEERLYTKWMDNGYFHAKVNPDKKPFTIVMPPPNVTGQLHMGHALDETMQDILHGFIQCMSHVKLAGYVWRRHNNGKRFLVRIYFCMEISIVHPFCVKTLFDSLRIVSFCKFFAHNVLLIIYLKLKYLRITPL